MTELLKQPQYSPIKTGIQVSLIYTANNAYIDDLEISHVEKWGGDFSDFLEASKGELLKKIENSWDEEIEGQLKDAITEFIQTRKE